MAAKLPIKRSWKRSGARGAREALVHGADVRYGLAFIGRVHLRFDGVGDIAGGADEDSHVGEVSVVGLLAEIAIGEGDGGLRRRSFGSDIAGDSDDGEAGFRGRAGWGSTELGGLRDLRRERRCGRRLR